MKKIERNAISMLMALEFGYKAHERGISLDQAREELFLLILNIVKGKTK